LETATGNRACSADRGRIQKFLGERAARAMARPAGDDAVCRDGDERRLHVFGQAEAAAVEQRARARGVQLSTASWSCKQGPD